MLRACTFTGELVFCSAHRRMHTSFRLATILFFVGELRRRGGIVRCGFSNLILSMFLVFVPLFVGWTYSAVLLVNS